MPELELLAGGAVGCFARPSALDALAEGAGLPLRVAPTELLLLGARAEQVVLEQRLATLDPYGLVLDLSSAYATWIVRGDDRLEAAKVLVREDDLLVTVSSVVSHHVRDRLPAACRDLAEVLAR